MATSKLFALAKIAGGHLQACKTIEFKAPDPAYKKQYIKDCSQQEKDAAERSRDIALKVLNSCLNSFNHVTVMPLGRDVWARLCRGAKVTFIQRRYAILSPERVKSLIEVMKKIQFKKDVHPNFDDVYAYVWPSDKSYTVYLCREFWNAPDRMRIDCKAGTLIHEVSHFLGTEDITYDQKSATGTYRMSKVSDRVAAAGDNKMRVRVDCYFGELSVVNANHLEYEFEDGVNHVVNLADPEFRSGRHACCGSTDEHSVCYLRMFMLNPLAQPDESFEIVLDKITTFG